MLPDRISAADPDDAPPVSLDELLAQGGPQLSVLRGRIDEALTAPAPAGSLGQVFDSLEPALRRPVEIFGLLHLAADRGWLSREGLEAYAAVRPDGSTRTFSVPRTPLPAPDDTTPDTTPGTTRDAESETPA